jgi:Foot protein 3
VRTLGKIAATLGVIGAIAVGSVVPAAAWYGYGYGYHHRYHHRYYDYYPRYHHRYYAHRSWWGGY